MKLDPWQWALIGALVLVVAWLFQKKHDSCGSCRNRWAQMQGTLPGAGAGAAVSDVAASTTLPY